MSYYVNQVRNDVHITAENWKRFQQNYPEQFREKRSDSDFFYWFDPEFDNGDVWGLCYAREKWDDDCEQWLQNLAPYIENSSEMVFRGEDECLWGYRFENGGLVEANAAVVSIPRNLDLEALKHSLALGKLTVEQTSQILDILVQLQR